MNEQEIRSAQDLDVALAGRAMSKHAQLLKTAEGKSFPWPHAAMMILACLMLIMGLIATARTELGTDLLPALLGTLILLSALVMRLEWQLRAISELLKRSEQRALELEKRTFAGRRVAGE